MAGIPPAQLLAHTTLQQKGLGSALRYRYRVRGRRGLSRDTRDDLDWASDVPLCFSGAHNGNQVGREDILASNSPRRSH